MKVAKEAGALLSYDLNLREALWPSLDEARTKILSIWDQVDIAKVSEVELKDTTAAAAARFAPPLDFIFFHSIAC
mgnify:FL=1